VIMPPTVWRRRWKILNHSRRFTVLSRDSTKFGTIVVDLERRRVVDLLADRVAARMADWFKQHPEVEIINRDRDGLYADAAALCIKMTARQIVNVDALKAASAEFTTMRGLAMRFRGLLCGGTVEKLDVWLKDARQSGIYGMQRFARALRHDIEAVRNAVLEPWSNGQTEGQINRLKTLKWAMYGRAGVDLLRARLMPLHN
jgi:transposase